MKEWKLHASYKVDIKNLISKLDIDLSLPPSIKKEPKGSKQWDACRFRYLKHNYTTIM